MEEESQPLLCQESVCDVVTGTELPLNTRNTLLEKLFPFGFWHEFKQLTKLAIPIAATSLVAFLSGPISIVLCGQLGKRQLATVGLAVSVFNVTGLAVVTGLLTAAGTLFSQTYGGEQKHMMGIQLQRALVIITFCCVPCISLHLLAEPLFLLLRQNPAVSKEAADYILCVTPGLWFAAIAQCLTKYVQAQNTVYPPLLLSIGSNCLNALLHYILLYELKVGLRGSAFSQVIAYAFQCVCLATYVKLRERRSNTWTGWSSKLWTDWGTWFKLAMPGLFMTTLEWSLFEIGTVIAGTLGQKQLAAQAILFNTESILYTLLPLGFGIATNVRVGQFLGAGSAVGPRSVLSVALIVVWIINTFLATCVILFRGQIPKIFSSDIDVNELTSRLLPVIAAFQFFDGIAGVCMGAICGAGLQLLGAITCFCNLYLLAAPISLILVLILRYDLNGIWIGFTVGTISQALVYFCICVCIDWKKQVKLARERTRDAYVTTADEFIPDGCNEGITTNTNTPNPFIRKEMQLKAIWKFPTIPRILFGSAMLIMLVTSISLRQCFPWSQYFGLYCVFPNDTFIHISDPVTVPTNCSIVVPGIAL